MRLAEDYVRLRLAFNQHPDQQSFHIAMEEVAQALFCTARNAKIIITKMVDAQWILFRSGRGRGHMSELTFLLPVTTVLLDEAKQRVIRGDVQSAFEWLQEHEALAIVRPLFVKWLISYFGYTTQQIGQDQIIETLRLPIYRPIVSLEPAHALYAFDTHLIGQIFSRLVHYDPVQSIFTKDIAHHWESHSDATCWTFYLRKGITFHNGQELTAQDVYTSLTQLQSPTVIHHWIGQDISHIQVINRYQIQIQLHRPNTHFLFYMSHSAASIFPSSEVDSQHEFSLPIGSGPYQVVSLHTGKCTLEVFPSYFGYRGQIDRIEIIIVPENEAEACLGTSPGVLTVITGEFSIPDDLEMPLTQTITGVSTLTFNLRKEGILQDKAFRKVLVDAIDRQRMIHELGETRLCPAHGLQIDKDSLHISSTECGLNCDKPFLPSTVLLESLQHTSYAGETLHLYTFHRHAKDAYWLQQQYQSYGIKIEVHIVKWSETLQLATMEQADLILFEAMVSENPLHLLEYIRSDRNFIRHSLPLEKVAQLDQLTYSMLASTDQYALTAWSTAVNRLLNDNWTSAFLMIRTASTIYHPSLHGVHVNHKGWVNFDMLWFHDM